MRTVMIPSQGSSYFRVNVFGHFGHEFDCRRRKNTMALYLSPIHYRCTDYTQVSCVGKYTGIAGITSIKTSCQWIMHRTK